MEHPLDISVLFLDIGGLILTNGWDRAMRRRAAETFGLDFDEMNERHNLTFDTYERGLLSLDEYLQRVVFHQARSFTPEQFKSFMFEQSQSLGDNLRLFREIADAYGLRVAAVSNEGRELATHRIRKFHLVDFMDFFIISSFVRFRKPDEDIFRLALDIAQVRPEQALYIDDRLLFVEVAQGMGIHSIYHEDLEKTCRSLEDLGLTLPESCVLR
ncbi:MAG: HAD-IA family hydrolase [Planctomycetes bacterium]|nr:HAD-IA family hydrolase [Planctomycetota bacterium]